MGRASAAAAAQHREEIVANASRLIRERGIEGVPIPAVMGSIGLTHGGFYRQFVSKEALAVEAVDHAQDASRAVIEGIGEQAADRDTAMREYVGVYLSSEHQRDVAGGCAYAALAGDVARLSSASAIRRTFSEGFERSIRAFAAMGTDGSEPVTDEEVDAAALEYATILGVTLMARATAGSPISDRLLAAARAKLLGSASD